MNIMQKLFFAARNKARNTESVIEVLRASPLLDPIWYRQRYSDLANRPIDVARHYVEFGAQEGRDPGPNFSTRFYLDQNPDVLAAGVNPLLHYIEYGQEEGRQPHGLEFDQEFYLALYPSVPETGLSPLEHFQTVGRDRFFHHAFDEQWYRSEYPDLADYQGSLREHYLKIGQYQARHPAFQSAWYVQEYPDVLKSGMSPLQHYRSHGVKEGRHAAFDRHFYLTEYSDIAQAGVDPFLHYRDHGRGEARYPAFNRRWYKMFYADIGASEHDPYEHYRHFGRAEGRPLSPLHWWDITKWGKPNYNAILNTPTTHEGVPPDNHPDFTPKVSVIVPNYNHARYLAERLDSIYNQTYQNFEVILLDDASKDNSVGILKDYASKYSEKTICIFNKENSGGVFHQWKRGLEAATGDLIWIAESDDYCELGFLSELVRFFRNNSVMLAFSRTDFVIGAPPRKMWTSEAYWSDAGIDFGSEPIIGPAQTFVEEAWAFRNIAANVSSVLFRNPGHIPLLDDPKWLGLRMCGDWVFYLALIRGGHVGYSPRVTNYYRQHEQNTSVGTHDKDIYYQEHEVTAEYIANWYKLDESILRRNEEVLYRHWCMKRGPDRRSDFEQLFRFDRLLSAQAARLPNIAIALYAIVPGGGETFPILVAGLLKARGFSVTLLNFEQEPTHDGIKGTIDRSIPILELENSAACAGILNQMRIEVVHSHHLWVDVTLGMALKDFPRIRHVITMHGLYETVFPERIKTLEPHLAGLHALVYIADKNLTTLSPAFKEKMNKFKVSNTVELKPLTGLTRKKLNLSSDDFVVCLASRAAADKGWEEAIQAVIAANKQSKRRIVLILVGEGPEFDRLSKSTLPDCIRLLGFQQNVRDFFAVADIGLIASRFKGESCPLVLIECLSVGTPMIASDIGEVRNMLAADDGLAGAVHSLIDWTIDVPRLSKIISDIANDAAEYARLRALVPKAAAKFDQQRMIDRYIDIYNFEKSIQKKGEIQLSVVLVVYNMTRELPRTLYTLSPAYQGLDESQYEVIVVDNGSKHAYDLNELHRVCPNLTFSSYIAPRQSPVDALNHGIKCARGAVVGAFIDGARMASPNLLRLAMLASKVDPRAVVGSLSFHLGPKAQNLSIFDGYNQAAEDRLLETVDWRTNGYELFNISTFDPSSRFGVYNCPAETNSLFMTRAMWEEYGGFDPAFQGRGGGLTNLDLWLRLCEEMRNQVVLLLGEGTFHQFHGGVATNAPVDAWPELHREYITIRGVDYHVPDRKPLVFGNLNEWIIEFLKRPQITLPTS